MITHPRLGEVMRFLRPAASPINDYTAQDDGAGPYLKANLTVNPVTDVEVAAVTNAQLDDALKTQRIGNATAQDLLAIVLALENDNRTIKAKINQLITDISASTTKFTAGQAAQITQAQLVTGLKALLS